MKNLFVACVLMFIATSAFALDSADVGQAGFDKLTVEQKAAIITQVTQQASQQATNVVSVDTVEKFAKIGPMIGQTIAAVAKETNVAVNEFVKTPVGFLTTALIVWYFVGGMVVHIFGAIVVWTIGFTVTTMIYRRQAETTITYDKDTGKKIKVVHAEIPSEASTAIWFAYVVVMIGGLITMFTF
jgi:hypothetical protein